jgi:Glyoxalase superfamily protein/Clp amino terminal domain, pathogenicity island component
MRDFRDAKAMAQTLRRALAAKGLTISHSESLELVAEALGVRDWNTLSATIRDATASPPSEPRPSVDKPRGTPNARGFSGLSAALEETLHRAVGFADERSHQNATPEHLLLALAEDAGAVAVLRACAIDVDLLRSGLIDYVDSGSPSLRGDDGGPAAPTPAFQRIIQRAVIHVHSGGLGDVTGANVLIALFSERDSHACKLLGDQGMTRLDALNFVAHGISKGDAAPV